jgi:hypothetical protein
MFVTHVSRAAPVPVKLDQTRLTFARENLWLEAAARQKHDCAGCHNQT